MNTVVISIGSNYNKYLNLSKCRIVLDQIGISVYYSDLLETCPYGIRYSKVFLNQLALIKTNLSYKELSKVLKQIESDLGRTVELEQKGLISLDLDVIQYKQERYKEKDWARSYVKDLIPNLQNKVRLSY